MKLPKHLAYLYNCISFVFPFVFQLSEISELKLIPVAILVFLLNESVSTVFDSSILILQPYWNFVFYLETFFSGETFSGETLKNLYVNKKSLLDLNDHLIIIKESPSKKRKKILGKKRISPDLGYYFKKTEKEMNKATILG